MAPKTDERQSAHDSHSSGKSRPARSPSLGGAPVMPEHNEERRAKTNALILRVAERPVERRATIVVAERLPHVTLKMGKRGPFLSITESRAQQEKELRDSIVGRKNEKIPGRGKEIFAELTPDERRAAKARGAGEYEANRFERQLDWTKQVVRAQASSTLLRAAKGAESGAKGAERLSSVAALTSPADGGVTAVAAAGAGAGLNAGSAFLYHEASLAERKDAADAKNTGYETTRLGDRKELKTSVDFRKEFAEKTADWADIKARTRFVSALSDSVGAAAGMHLPIGDLSSLVTDKVANTIDARGAAGGLTDNAGLLFAGEGAKDQQNVGGALTHSSVNYVSGRIIGWGAESLDKNIAPTKVTKESAYQARADVAGTAFQEMEDNAATKLARNFRKRLKVRKENKASSMAAPTARPSVERQTDPVAHPSRPSPPEGRPGGEGRIHRTRPVGPRPEKLSPLAVAHHPGMK